MTTTPAVAIATDSIHKAIAYLEIDGGRDGEGVPCVINAKITGDEMWVYCDRTLSFLAGRTGIATIAFDDAETGEVIASVFFERPIAKGEGFDFIPEEAPATRVVSIPANFP